MDEFNRRRTTEYEPPDEYEEEPQEDLSEDEELLSLFKGHRMPTPRTTSEMYQKGLGFNTQINLDETVRVNENMFIGKQWEGVPANNLPTPQINILKRVGLFTVATVVSDNIKVTAAPLANTVGTSRYKDVAQYINDEFEAIFERNKVPDLVKEFARDACVDGDGCIYTYWDANAETGQEASGQIRSEIIENTRVLFGNPSDVRVQTQPWIIISRRMPERSARLLARNNGSPDWRRISAHPDEIQATDDAKWNDELVTVLTLFWRDDDTNEIWSYVCTDRVTVEQPKNIGIKLYPICWLCWDRVRDCYHGQAMITGLVPNQVSINKTHALTQVSMMNMAFPSKVYDQTRIKKITNQVGAAYGVQGTVDNAMKVIEGANISPQVFQYIQSLIEQTEQSLGATSVALGDTRPDNTSAIIALQRAAATPSELTKQNIYSAVEDLARIYLEFMGEYYGIRYVDRPAKQQEQMAVLWAQQSNPDLEIPEEVPEPFDFGLLKESPVIVKIDVGGSTYYSETAAVQTLENLLMQGQINVVQFLERLPDEYITDRIGLIREKKQELMQMQQGTMGGGMPPEGGGAPSAGGIVEMGALPEVRGGPGYGSIQHQINKTGDVKGLV